MRSQAAFNEYYGESKLGSMKTERWEQWIGWLREKGMMEEDELKIDELWTNRFVNREVY